MGLSNLSDVIEGLRDFRLKVVPWETEYIVWKTEKSDKCTFHIEDGTI